MTITVRAPAKINLALHITARRDDGYHLLDSLVTFTTKLADILTISPSTKPSFTVSGEFSTALLQTNSDSNLIWRSIDLFHQKMGHNGHYAIHLEKNIPIGAGLGGGSSDAAATITALEYLTGLKIPDDQRLDFLLSLGADVPMCMRGRPLRVQGIGEDLSISPIFPTLPCVLIWPAVSCSTKDVFQAFDADFAAPLAQSPSYKDRQSFYHYLSSTKNSLEKPACVVCPAINEALIAFLPFKAAFTRMTGSGSCVIGYFETEIEAEKCSKILQEKRPDWWIKSDITQPSEDQTTP
jgi:4-diphosphocytidyl-2-C-methyl-D-erythritol kinase